MSGVGWVVVGAGWVVRDHMAPALASAADRGSRVVAVVDRDLAAAERLASRFAGAVASTSLAEAMASPGASAVYVATPNDAHLAGVRAAAEAGLPVLCEKPLAASLTDATAVVEACAGRLAASAYDQRWHPAHRELARRVAAGDLGTVTAIRIVYGCWLPPQWIPPGDATGENWRADPARAGGGAYVDLAPHGIDLVGVLLGGDDLVEVHTLLQRRVHAYAVDDGAVVVGRTGGDVLVSQHVSYNTADALPRRVLEVVGTDAQLVAVDTMGQVAGGMLTRVDAITGGREDIAFDTTLDPFAAQLAAFEDAVLGRTPWPYALGRDLALLTLLHNAVSPTEALR